MARENAEERNNIFTDLLRYYFEGVLPPFIVPIFLFLIHFLIETVQKNNRHLYLDLVSAGVLDLIGEIIHTDEHASVLVCTFPFYCSLLTVN